MCDTYSASCPSCVGRLTRYSDIGLRRTVGEQRARSWLGPRFSVAEAARACIELYRRTSGGHLCRSASVMN